MKIEPLGDSAFIVRDLPGPAYAYAEALIDLHIPGLQDAAASYDTLGIYTAPGAIAADHLTQALENLRAEITQPNRHKIPVIYDGDDLKEIAKQLGLAEEDVIKTHCSVEYQCFAVGFCPGFAYLGWLPDELSGIPRLQTPRTRTEPGSVGITGRQTGVYPLPRPGGWPIIGRTPLTLVDVDDNYFPIRAGDLISFNPIDEEEFRKLKGERL